MRQHHENRNLHRIINDHPCIHLASALRLRGDLMKNKYFGTDGIRDRFSSKFKHSKLPDIDLRAQEMDKKNLHDAGLISNHSADEAAKAISEATATLRDSFENRKIGSLKNNMTVESKDFIKSIIKADCAINKKLKPFLCTTLHKSRFEGDNFRKRYMSKCQGESTSEKIERLERIERVAIRALKLWREGHELFNIEMDDLEAELEL